MKLRLTLLVCTFALVACHAAPRTLTLDRTERGESYEYAAARTYQVETRTGWGSGWAWDHDTIVTNYHVVGPTPPLFVTVHQGGLTWEVIAIERLDNVDAVLLHVTGPPLTLAPVRADTPKPGEIVTMSGHPHANPEPIVTWGLVAGRWFYEELVVDGAIIPGMSGGPVFDEQGRVVGMNVATTLPPGRALGLVIPIWDIIKGM